MPGSSPGICQFKHTSNVHNIENGSLINISSLSTYMKHASMYNVITSFRHNR